MRETPLFNAGDGGWKNFPPDGGWMRAIFHQKREIAGEKIEHMKIWNRKFFSRLFGLNFCDFAGESGRNILNMRERQFFVQVLREMGGEELEKQYGILEKQMKKKPL